MLTFCALILSKSNIQSPKKIIQLTPSCKSIFIINVIVITSVNNTKCFESILIQQTKIIGYIWQQITSHEVLKLKSEKKRRGSLPPNSRNSDIRSFEI